MTQKKPGIVPRPSKSDAAANRFIDGAPDSGAAKHARRAKIKISLTVPDDLLQDSNEAAATLGLSRAAFINMAIAQLTKKTLAD